MDMSFCHTGAGHRIRDKKRRQAERESYTVPEEIENWVANLKLKSMGIEIDQLTTEQKRYLDSLRT